MGNIFWGAWIFHWGRGKLPKLKTMFICCGYGSTLVVNSMIFFISIYSTWYMTRKIFALTSFTWNLSSASFYCSHLTGNKSLSTMYSHGFPLTTPTQSMFSEPVLNRKFSKLLSGYKIQNWLNIHFKRKDAAVPWTEILLYTSSFINTHFLRKKSKIAAK